MALNPQLYPAGLPVLFENETMALARDGVEISIDKIPNRGRWSATGTVYVSNFRVVFVASPKAATPEIRAFDLPLLMIQNEAFNQPIFGCNNISGTVLPVIPPGHHPSMYAPHSFAFYFKNGGCGTFVPLFFSFLQGARAFAPPPPPPLAPNDPAPPSAPPVFQGGGETLRGTTGIDSSSLSSTDPLPSTPLPVADMIRSAYVDPNDPTTVYITQPYDSSHTLRRRNYRGDADNA